MAILLSLPVEAQWIIGISLTAFIAAAIAGGFRV